jgi:hypothetical protein
MVSSYHLSVTCVTRTRIPDEDRPLLYHMTPLPVCGAGINRMPIVQAPAHRVTLDNLSAVLLGIEFPLRCYLNLSEDTQAFLFLFQHACSVKYSPHLDHKQEAHVKVRQ